MSRITEIASRMIQNNPNIQSTPWAPSAINAILNGDAKTGEQIANNLLQSMGMTKEQALDLARKQHLF